MTGNELDPDINIFEVERITGEAVGMSIIWPSGVDILIDRRDPFKGNTLLCEIGFVHHYVREKFGLPDKESVDDFVKRKTKEYGLIISNRGPYPQNDLLPISKQERKVLCAKDVVEIHRTPWSTKATDSSKTVWLSSRCTMRGRVRKGLLKFCG